MIRWSQLSARVGSLEAALKAGPPPFLRDCSGGRIRKSEEADFFRIKVWNSQAEAAADNLAKGRRVGVEGALRQDTYEKDGEERKAVSVVARRLEYL